MHFSWYSSARQQRARERVASFKGAFFASTQVATWELKSCLARLQTGRGPPFCDPMDLFWHINPVEMLSDLMVTTFLILLAASVVVVASMFMFPLIDLAFKKKGKTAPKDTEPRHHDGLTAYHAPRQLSGAPWLALRSDFSRPDALAHSQLTSDPPPNARRPIH